MKRATIAALIMALFGSLLIGTPAAAAPSQLRIMGLGDSITYGLKASGGVDGYRTKLDQYIRTGSRGTVLPVWVGDQLNSASLPAYRHEGHSGWTMEQISALIDTGVLTKHNPHVVLLHIGTNDIFGGQSSSSALTELQQLIAKIRSKLPSAIIIVARITDLGATASADEQKRNDEYAWGIPNVVKAAEPNVFDANMHGIGDPYLADNRHPNNEGYKRMAIEWYKTFVWKVFTTWIPVDQMIW